MNRNMEISTDPTGASINPLNPSQNTSKATSGPSYFLTQTELAQLVGKSLPAISKRLDKESLIQLKGNRVGVPSHVVRKYLETEGLQFDPVIIAHLNLRGGIAKTTASINLASRGYEYGHKVCLIDLDSQGSASLAFGISTKEEDPVFIDIWEDPKSIMNALIEIEPGFSILPSSLNNGLLDSALSKAQDQRDAVANCCSYLQSQGFTLIVIDCPPSLGAAIVSTICAADILVVPVAPDVFSIRGLELTSTEIEQVCKTFHLDQPEVRILFSKYDGREKLSLDTLTKLAKHPKFSSYLLPTFIRTSTEHSKAIAMKRTVFGSLQKNIARDDYDMYTKNVLGLDRVSRRGGEA